MCPYWLVIFSCSSPSERLTISSLIIILADTSNQSGKKLITLHCDTPTQLTSISQYLSTRLRTTHNYITVCVWHRSCCLYFPLHHTHLLMHSLLPFHGAASWHYTFLSTAPDTFHKLPNHIQGPNVLLPLYLPLYHGPIPTPFINHPISTSLLSFAFPYIDTCSCWLDEKVPLSMPYVGHTYNCLVWDILGTSILHSHMTYSGHT